LNKIQKLKEILYDENAREDERDDAAIYLGNYVEEESIKVLIEFASREYENDTLLASCGISLAEIINQIKDYDLSFVKELSEMAKSEFLSNYKGFLKKE
jgi:hypothetical protein